MSDDGRASGKTVLVPSVELAKLKTEIAEIAEARRERDAEHEIAADALAYADMAAAARDEWRRRYEAAMDNLRDWDNDIGKLQAENARLVEMVHRLTRPTVDGAGPAPGSLTAADVPSVPTPPPDRGTPNYHDPRPGKPR